MPHSFADLGVPADLVAVLTQRGITSPFPIQASALPDALAGRDLCGRAPTGSGKTLAFGLALAARVEKASPRRPRALVLVPTRELAEQVRAVLAPLLTARRRSVESVYGGVGFERQRRSLQRGVDVLVACPGRLADLVRQGDVSLGQVSLVVVDEADRLADMGFLPEVKRLLDQTASERQTLLFSATLDGDVDVLVRRYQRDPARCEVESEPDSDERVEHRFLRVGAAERVATCASLVAELGATVVFTRTKRGADRVAAQLAKAGVATAAIHGGRSQPQRDRALRAFHERKIRALVATDVAARGIHVDGVSCVVHFDPPADEKGYVHRSGRTGRAGATGVVVSLVQPDQTASARRLQQSLGLKRDGHAAAHAPGSRPEHSEAQTSSKPPRHERESERRDERARQPAARRDAARPRSRPADPRTVGGRAAARRGARGFAAPWQGEGQRERGGAERRPKQDTHASRAAAQPARDGAQGQRNTRADSARQRDPQSGAARQGGKFSWQPAGERTSERSSDRQRESGGKFSWTRAPSGKRKPASKRWRAKRAAG